MQKSNIRKGNCEIFGDVFIDIGIGVASGATVVGLLDHLTIISWGSLVFLGALVAGLGYKIKTIKR